MKRKQPNTPPTAISIRRIVAIGGITLVSTLPFFGSFLYIIDKTYDFPITEMVASGTSTTTPNPQTLPFPLGVIPEKKLIVEQDNIETYLRTPPRKISARNQTIKPSFVQKTIAKLALFDWFQNLAAGASRVLIVEPGERREQIATNFGKILKWSDTDKREFLASVVSADPVILEGKFSSGSYIVAREAKPSEVAPLIVDRFNTEVASRYTKDIAAVIPLNDTLTVASLLEREAYDFDDMRYISGVIWNRLFIGMNLQIDATLQYAKGTNSVKTWWPVPTPKDKYIDSPYNTYKNGGLPPTPIANPSTEAILAALNPKETDCLYYFHDRDGGFHCTVSYKEHVELLKQYYGTGK